MTAKKTFKELYDEELRKPTAAQKFVREVSELTHRSEVTVRMWLSGRQVPDELAQTTLCLNHSSLVKNKINMYESELKLANVDTCSIWNDLPCVHCRRTDKSGHMVS